MLTRAYDTIMASLQVPMIVSENVDFNTSAIDDRVLNCRDCDGHVRTIAAAGSYFGTSSGSSGISQYPANYPFAAWNCNGDLSLLLPDEEEAAPSYEDYSVSDGIPSGWGISSKLPPFTKTYDPDTKEIVCSVTILWQNTSGAAKTVYGVKIRNRCKYRAYHYNSSYPDSYFLVCREHFASPVVVEDQGLISLAFTWRVGRAGLVSATAAAAE